MTAVRGPFSNAGSIGKIDAAHPCLGAEGNEPGLAWHGQLFGSDSDGLRRANDAFPLRRLIGG